MKRILSVITLATTVALGSMAVSSPADARNNGAIIGGVVGGLALGAIIGGAAAQQRGYYDGPNYAYQSGYGYQPAYVAPQSCVAQQEVWSRRHQAYVVRNVRVAC
jgi:hypothetical protein